MKFKDLKVGDTFMFCKIKFVKLSDNKPFDVALPLDRQVPNCMDLLRLHYCVVGANAKVMKLKSLEQYYDPYGISDYCDKEE